MSKLRLIKGKRPVQDYVMGKCKVFGTMLVPINENGKTRLVKMDKPIRTDTHTLVLIDGHVQLVAKKNLEAY